MLQTISQARGDGYLVFKLENLGFRENMLWGDAREAAGLCACSFPAIPTVYLLSGSS